MLISERVSTIAVPISKLQTTVPTFLQILVHKQPAARKHETRPKALLVRLYPENLQANVIIF
jgi:hypothetical protein